MSKNEKIRPSNIALIHWLGLDQFEPHCAVNSHFVSSRTLFLIRLPLALYTLVVLWVDVIWAIKSNEINHFFAYFTDLTFIGLHAYMITTCIHHAKYLWSESSSSQRPSSYLDQPNILNYLYVYLYHTVIVFNIQTPVIFWGLLAKEKLFEAHLSPIDFWVSISVHTISLCILMIEIFFNKMIVHSKMVLLVFGTVLLYMFLTFIIFASESWWVYSFLDWRTGPSVIIYYVVISFFVVVLFYFQWGLHKLRDWIARPNNSKVEDEKKTRPDPMVTK
ncbi:hypothetical protein K501DRAFT_295620 [Backusella circina FSU 941]|nr:hypothetical protein K501DRAFT_295620 [Backusella circina FSU 941]